MPEPGNPQSLNRYSYVLNNALKYTDPTGHANEATGGVADLYAWAELLDHSHSQKFHGWLHERDSAWANYLIAKREGAPPEVVSAAADMLEARQNALLINGYRGVATAQQTAFESYGVDVGTGVITFASGAAQLGGAVLIYKKGPDTDMNLTPRPVKDTQPGGGLSFYDSLTNPHMEIEKGDKYLVVDIGKLKELQAINDNDPPGHWTVRPESYSDLLEWAATRGAGIVHRFTDELRQAIQLTGRWR